MTVIMQAVSSSNGQAYQWNADDWDAGAGFPGPGAALHVVKIAGLSTPEGLANLPVLPANQAWRQKDDGSKPIGSHLAYSLDMFGVTPANSAGTNDTGITAALATLTSITVPIGEHSISGQFRPALGSHLKGEGWQATVISPLYQDGSWASAGFIKGSVFRQTNTAAGATFMMAEGINGHNAIHADYAIIGPGTTGSIGHSFDAYYTPVAHSLRNVGFCNFDVGVRLGLLQNAGVASEFSFSCFGCNVGVDDVHLSNPTPSTNIRAKVWLQACNYGVLVTSNSIKLDISGLIQSSQVAAVVLKPATGGLVSFHMHDTWIEGAVVGDFTDDLVLDTTAGGSCSITAAKFDDNYTAGYMSRIGLGSPVNGCVFNSAGGYWALTLGPNDIKNYINCSLGFLLDYGNGTIKGPQYILQAVISSYHDANAGLTMSGSDVVQWASSQAATYTLSGAYTGHYPTRVTDWSGALDAIKCVSGGSASDLQTYEAAVTALSGTFTWLQVMQFRFDSVPNSSGTYLWSLVGTANKRNTVQVIGDGTHATLRLIRSDGTNTLSLDTPLDAGHGKFTAGVNYELWFAFDGNKLLIGDASGTMAFTDGATGIGSQDGASYTVNGYAGTAQGDITIRREMFFVNPVGYVPGYPMPHAHWGAQIATFWKELG